MKILFILFFMGSFHLVYASNYTCIEALSNKNLSVLDNSISSVKADPIFLRSYNELLDKLARSLKKDKIELESGWPLIEDLTATGEFDKNLDRDIANLAENFSLSKEDLYQALFEDLPQSTVYKASSIAEGPERFSIEDRLNNPKVQKILFAESKKKVQEQQT